jgi:hypothetical protein
MAPRVPLPVLALGAALLLTLDAIAQQPAYAPAPPQWKVDATSNSMVLAPTTSAKLALGRSSAKTALHIEGDNVTAQPGTGSMILGPMSGPHMQLDRNDIRVAGPTNTTVGSLYLQRYGGPIVVHASKPLEDRIYITSTGNLGVGVSDPLKFALDKKMHQSTVSFPSTIVSVNGSVYANELSGIDLKVLNRVRIGRRINSQHGIGYPAIDLAYTDAALQVAGTVTAQSIVVHLEKWADDVFDTGYPLMPINELRTFVERERHLPGVPTTRDMQNSGLDLAWSSEMLLRKVEELTLYTIAQQQRIDELERRVDALTP